MFRYLANLHYGMKILWCYFLWYLYFVCTYFELDLELWSRSTGIAILVGFALNINGFGSIGKILSAKNKWQVFRFFLVPFCVSSFPSLIKGKGFWLFFSPEPGENLIACTICVLFLFLAWICEKYYAESPT
ncbi:MAG: hypothetical protein JRH13_05820 [Deltaproteobacteria bacterium]|nr:hypothetical protein [Deltaproteobacteria bacterium]MBW2015824.1 hypothetical protein [Deltaproteobacteria bacterium]MBW2128863.1 hypothetical protein [Deltaproteobacteria bacterium]MBW2304450.1 hypothetical protein [Deltaproteobacteria bacterium]